MPQIQSEKLINCGFNEKSLCFWKDDIENSQFEWAIHGSSDVLLSGAPATGAFSSSGYIYVRRSLSFAGSWKLIKIYAIFFLKTNDIFLR